MSIPFKKYGYTINPITDEIEEPQVFLVNKRLKKMGELYPIENLKIKVNEVNQPDEISFTYYKEVNDKECPLFDKIADLAVIQVENFGFFECEISKEENDKVLKNVYGKSLGIAELSQILATLEINTDDDIARNDYDINYPTVFYRDISFSDSKEVQKKKKESSLLHRILSYAPHYKVGYVDPTLKNVQRTFSWEDTDIVSVLNDVATEVNCIFDIKVTINEDGDAERIINAYDMQYCENCWNALDVGGQKTTNTHTFRNIVNGVCQNCGSSKYVKDIGKDTNIFISTENLSDDITITGDKDSIKNCFKVTGGDDLMTATVKGLNMSANNRIMIFSEEQRKLMSQALIEKLDDYEKDYNAKQPDYEKLLETQYNIYDMIQYLQSGKMPLLEEEITTTIQALFSVISQITTYYNNRFYISSWNNYSYVSAKTSIQNLFTTFMPKGFSFSIDTDSIDSTTSYESSKKYHWYGSIKIYSTDNKDDYYTLYVTETSGTYVRHGKTDEPISYVDTDNIIGNFSIIFNFADKDQENYMSYLKQHTEYLLSEVDLSYENEKARDWDQYSYNRLKSYFDGFQTCIETLDDMLREHTTTDSSVEVINTMKESYTQIQKYIHEQMLVLQDQIYALSTYLGEFSNEFVDDEGRVTYKLQRLSNVSDILAHMIDPQYIGGYSTNADGTKNESSFTPNQFIGTKPCKCKKCGSINVSATTETSNICNNCGSKEIYSYLDMMEDIVKSYEENKVTNPNSNIADLRQEIQNIFNTQAYFNDDALYYELLSFTREDVYSNENYTSDGLTNAQLISQAKELMVKAKQELSKACMTQYTVTVPISAIVAQTAFMYQGVLVNDNYSGFILNNYVRVRIDDEIYKMRISSISLNFPITDKIDVTFTNVSRYNNGATSDIASILESASNMATSYSYVATQAEKGQQANDTFDTIKSEGLDAGLMAVKGGRDQDIVIDNHGILLRKKIQEIDEYSPYQMKLINRNIVMTDDNWNTAKMAIGYGMYNGQPVYGIWCDLLVGTMTLTKNLHVVNDKNTVIIDENGITLDGGAIKWINKGVADQITIYYAVSSSSTTHPAEDSSDWKETFTGTLNNNYLWSKTVKIDTAGNKTTTYNCLGNSPDGIKLTKKQYYLSTSSTSVTGGTWLDYQPTWTGSGYVWTRTHIEYISGASKNVNTIYDSGLTASLKDLTGFKNKVTDILTAGSATTEIGSDYVISPKIGGGYLYITNDNYSVEIDPNHGSSDTLDGYLFCIRNGNNRIMSVDTSGNGYFNGDIVTNNIVANKGNIGSWEFDGYNIYNGNGYGYICSIDFGKPEKPVGGYTIEGQEYYPCQRITSGKTIYSLYYKRNSLSDNTLENFNPNNFTENYQYADVSCDGFYCSNGTLGSDYLFAAKTREGIVEMNGEVKMNGKVKVFNGLRIQATSSDYVELSTTAYDSSAANAYLVNNGSMKIGHRLQVGDASLGYDPDHTFRVVGSSWVTGTSYTNSGITVTSDRNKKNSISTPSDCYIQLFDAISLRSFKYNDGTSDRYHLGVIAQELEEAMRSIGISSQDFGGLVVDGQGNYFVRYDEINILTALKVKQLEESRKESQREIEELKENYQRDICELKNELAELKSKLSVL